MRTNSTNKPARSRFSERATLGAFAAALALTSCGLFSSGDKFTGYRLCGRSESRDDACVMLLGLTEDANYYEVEIVEETDTEIRIRVEAIGSPEGDEEKGLKMVELSQPLGDRAVIDDTSGESVPFVER